MRTYRPPEVNIEAASRSAAPGQTNIHLQRFVINTLAELKLHRTKLGMEAVSTSQHGSAAPPPTKPVVAIGGDASKGRYFIAITNPEYANPKDATGNSQKTPLDHEVVYATRPDFLDAVTLPPGPSTYYPILQDPDITLYVKTRSSADGIHWTPWQTTVSSSPQPSSGGAAVTQSAPSGEPSGPGSVNEPHIGRIGNLAPLR
jgi:hypothetical protein